MHLDTTATGNSGAGPTVSDAPAPLGVALRAMSERTRALLCWHFGRARPQRLTETAAHEIPHALFVDADHPAARTLLDTNLSGACLPVVLLAVDPHRHAVRGPIVEVIAKPVTAVALARVTGLLTGNEPPAVTEPVVPPPDVAAPSGIAPEPVVPLLDPPTNTTAPPVPGEDPAAPARAVARFDILCGTEQAIEAARRDRFDTPGEGTSPLYYDPRSHLTTRIERELAHSLRDRRSFAPDTPSGSEPLLGFGLSMTHIDLFVLPELDRVYVTATLRSVSTARRTFADIEPDDLTVTHYRGPTMSTLLQRVQALAKTGYTIDGFLWLAALMSSRGRLPLGTDTRTPYRLQRWPNLTRLEPLPDSIEICGCWAAGPASIDEVIERTGVHPRVVHAFHNAARTLGALVPETAPDA